MSRLAAPVGLALLAAHAALLPVALQRCGRPALAVMVTAPAADASWSVHGVLPDGLAARTEITIDGAPATGAALPPGLHRQTWTTRYRGDVVREVSAVQLVGPFQDPAAPPCSGRVIVGQALLDDGHAGDGTIAAVMKRELATALRDVGQFPIGDFKEVRSLALTWSRLEDVPADRDLVGAGGAPHGYVRAEAELVFARVAVPVTLALVPRVEGDAIAFTIHAKARLAFGNRVLQWASDLLGGDKLATKIARQQIDASVLTAIAPPPPLELPGGRTLTFDYCGAPLEMATGAWAALPLAVKISAAAGAPAILPPRHGPSAMTPPRAGVPVTLDLDLDALNALLYELWRTGLLDERLAAAGLDRRFNEDPTVAAMLSIRASPLRLALPPVAALGDDGLRLGAAFTLAVGDGGASTRADLFAELALRLPGATAASSAAAIDLHAFALTCEPTPGRLEPCYPDLVSALRARAPEAHAILTSTFDDLLAQLFVGARLGDPSVPAALAVAGATPRATASGLRVELAARVVPP